MGTQKTPAVILHCDGDLCATSLFTNRQITVLLIYQTLSKQLQILLSSR